jgi:hypothetical protein
MAAAILAPVRERNPPARFGLRTSSQQAIMLDAELHPEP